MGKKIRKAIGALLMALALAVTQIPVSDVEAVETAPASDFQVNDKTLVKYNGTAQDVSIGNSVDKIATEAFAGNTYVKSITIGNGVKTIGSGAFEGCTNLQTVVISNSVEVIEQAAFADCPALRSVKIGTGLKELGNGAFAGDRSLETVEFSGSNPNFICEDGAIYSKGKKDILYAVLSGRKNNSYAMPMSVSVIKPYAFWGDKYLDTVSISGNVKEISAYAFSNCSNLKNVSIPLTVNIIGLKAFEDCIRLRTITIPVSVRIIHSTAFDGCTKLKIKAEEGSTAKAFADNLVLEDIEVSEYEDTPIDTITETDETGDPEDSVEDTPAVVDYYHEVTHINPLSEDDDASVKGKSRIVGGQVVIFMDNAGATVNSGSSVANALDGITYGETGETIASISGNNGKGGSFPKYTIVDDQLIASQAYYGDERSSIEIPDTITEIGDFAFARSGITQALIPDSVTKIGYAAFYHCNDLTDVVIPNSVTEIAPSAFEKTPWLTNWEKSSGNEFLVVGDGILLDYCGSSSTVSIPGTVKTVGAGALRGHKEITNLILPDSVEIIGEEAFSGCSGLVGIEGGDSVREIRDRAFEGCSLQEIYIPASVENIGLKAFAVSDFVKSAGTGTVVFEGTSLPTLSYEDSSGKLYNENYRGLAFEGINNAVVPDSIDSLAGSVLDESLSGFRGVVRTVGNRQLADTTDNNEEVSSSSGTVDVHVNSSTINTDGLALAVLDGAEEDYILNIVDSDDAKTAIQDAYRKLNGNQVPTNLQAYEITLKETDTSIPITGLGKQKMEVTIPLPNGIGEESLHVVCLDADGQLEEVDSHVSSMDGMDCLVFTANHFSPYGVYNYASYTAASGGNTAVVSGGQAVFTNLSSNKDASPDTGDHDIHPKWFLGAGLLFTGLALFFYRGKRWKKEEDIDMFL